MVAEVHECRISCVVRGMHTMAGGHVPDLVIPFVVRIHEYSALLAVAAVPVPPASVPAASRRSIT